MFILTPMIEVDPDTLTPFEPPAGIFIDTVLMDSSFAILEVVTPSEVIAELEVFRVPRTVSLLIEAAQGYRPALARARDRLRSVFTQRSRDEFLDAVTSTLREELARQPSDRAGLVLARTAEGPYRAAGHYVWALKLYEHDGTDMLQWISRDDDIHDDAAEHFELTPELRQRLRDDG